MCEVSKSSAAFVLLSPRAFVAASIGRMDVIVNDGCFAALNGYSSQDGIKIGLAFLRPRARSDRTDKHHRQLVLVEFLDSDCYGNTEAAITSFGPSSVFIADGCLPDREMEKLTSVLSQFDDASTERLSKSKFGGDVASRLQKLTGGPIAHVENMPLALHAAACLINTGDLMSDASNEGAVEIVAGALDTYLRIDGSAIRALNLFPSRRDAEAVPLNVNNPGLDYDGLLPSAAASKPAARNITSLHELLGFHCKTKGGKRALRRWLLQPLTNPTAINRRQDLVAAFASSVSLRRGWQEGVNIPDLESLGFRLQNKKAGLMDLVRLYSFAKQLPSIIAKLNVDDDDGGDHQAARTVLQSEYIAILEKRAEDFSDYITMMEALLEDPSVNDRPRIKRSWNEKLKELAEERDEIEAGIQACWDKFQRDYDYGSEVKCERDKNRGFWFRTPKKNDKAVRSTATVQIHSVQTDGIHFSNASLRSLSERLLEIESEYEDTQKAVVDEAVTVARTYLPVLEGAGTAIAELDVFASMAIVATTSTSPYVRPALTGIQPGQPRRLRIVQGRHPVVEMQEEVSFIANDYSMDACSDSDADASNSATAGAGAASSSLDAAGRFHIITGPNMGGKSTLIRTLGVLCLMAQIGSFIPAESAEVPILDCICARVGAGDRALKVREGYCLVGGSLLVMTHVLGVAGYDCSRLLLGVLVGAHLIPCSPSHCSVCTRHSILTLVYITALWRMTVLSLFFFSRPRSHRFTCTPCSCMSAGRVHLHGRDAGGVLHPRHSDAQVTRHHRRAGPRHQHVRRLWPRMGHQRALGPHNQVPDHVRDALPRADGAGGRAAVRSEEQTRDGAGIRWRDHDVVHCPGWRVPVILRYPCR